MKTLLYWVFCLLSEEAGRPVLAALYRAGVALDRPHCSSTAVAAYVARWGWDAADTVLNDYVN